MRKILLLSTGGTIASTPGENGLTPTMTGQFMVELIPELEGLCEIHCKELLSLDSSNMQPEDWAVIAKAVFAAVEVFDGDHPWYGYHGLHGRSPFLYAPEPEQAGGSHRLSASHR